jgi:hypothetical protein
MVPLDPSPSPRISSSRIASQFSRSSVGPFLTRFIRNKKLWQKKEIRKHENNKQVRVGIVTGNNLRVRLGGARRFIHACTNTEGAANPA